MTEALVSQGQRVSTGISGFDRVLGYNRFDQPYLTGFVRTSSIFVFGPPGVGKSMLLMEMCRRCLDRSVAYCSSERTLEEIQQFSGKVDFCIAETKTMSSWLNTIRTINSRVVVVDSVDKITGMPREMIVNTLAAEAIEHERTIFISSGRAPSTGSGHNVSAVLQLKSVETGLVKLSAIKNRFGSVSSTALFALDPLAVDHIGRR